MTAVRVLLMFIFTLMFTGQALGSAVSSGSTSFNGKTVRYTFTGDEVSALSYAKDGTCRVTATIDGDTHRIVISEDQLTWNGGVVALDGFEKVKIVMDKTKARFAVDGREVKVAPAGKVE